MADTGIFPANRQGIEIKRFLTMGGMVDHFLREFAKGENDFEIRHKRNQHDWNTLGLDQLRVELAMVENLSEMVRRKQKSFLKRVDVSIFYRDCRNPIAFLIMEAKLASNNGLSGIYNVTGFRYLRRISEAKACFAEFAAIQPKRQVYDVRTEWRTRPRDTPNLNP